MDIRRFQTKDAEETAQVISETLRVSNSKDYPEEYIVFKGDTIYEEIFFDDSFIYHDACTDRL